MREFSGMKIFHLIQSDEFETPVAVRSLAKVL